MNINELKTSNFLKKEDVGTGVLLTIREVKQENVAQQGAPQELRWCIHFDEADKPMVLNSTNGQLLAKIFGSEESDAWIGKKIVLFTDPNISFGGKVVGGIRVRAPKTKTAAPIIAPAPIPTPPPVGAPEADDDVPF